MLTSRVGSAELGRAELQPTTQTGGDGQSTVTVPSGLRNRQQETAVILPITEGFI